MDYANTTNVEFIVDPKVLFYGWLIYSYLQIFKLIKCKWLPGECADWFFGNNMTWSYCLHRRYSMSQQKNSILINEHALNREPVPLIRTPKGQNQVSFLQRCPSYRGRECMMFGISGTKRAVRNREVSVRRGQTVLFSGALARGACQRSTMGRKMK